MLAFSLIEPANRILPFHHFIFEVWLLLSFGFGLMAEGPTQPG